MGDHLLLIAREGCLLALMLATPLVAAALVTGFVVSALQATTQIQESSLTFAPRLVAVTGAQLLAGPWILDQLLRFTRVVFESIAWIG